MTWTCEQTEARLSDYLDGVLNPAELAEFTAHVPSCARCAPLVASVSELLTGLHGMELIAEPPRLVYAILDKTLGPREALTGWRAILGWVRGVASIRFAYGALSVAATLIIFITASGFNWRHPKLADLNLAAARARSPQRRGSRTAPTTWPGKYKCWRWKCQPLAAGLADYDFEERAMKCAVHPDADAIGYCRNCGKALCAVCVRPVRDVLYCEDCLANVLGI